MHNINLVCTQCQKSCNLNIFINQDEITNITGNSCNTGIKYAKNELIIPSRIVTTIVYVANGSLKTIPVKSDNYIPNSIIYKVLKELDSITVNAPIHIGDIIKENICNTGVNIIATKSVSISS